MFNPHFVNNWDVFFVMCSCLMAIITSIYNFRAYRFVGNYGTSRVRFLTIGIWAGLYSIAYAFLGLSDVMPLKWSSVMRGVGLVSWFGVWLLPARQVRNSTANLTRAIVEEVKKEIA